MAELLIKAKGHWMDGLTEKEVAALREDQRLAYEARTQKGDIIVVRPDGWPWGRMECLPDFVVVKISDKYDQAKKYEEPLFDDKSEDAAVLKFRKYCVSVQEVERVAGVVKDYEEISAVNLLTAINEKESISGDTAKENS